MRSGCPSQSTGISRPALVGVADEVDAAEVVRLALEPVHAGPQRCQRRDAGQSVEAVLDTDLEAHAGIQVEAAELVDQVEAGLALEPVDGGDEQGHLELEPGIVPEDPGGVDQPFRRQEDGAFRMA